MSDNIYLEHYNKQASTYELVHPFTKDIAAQLIKITPDLNSESAIHDNACGPGIVTEQLIQHFEASTPRQPLPRIHATDFSPAMIDVLDQKIHLNHWSSNITSAVSDAESLSAQNNSYTHSITNFGIFLVPHPDRAAQEIHRTLLPGGVAVLTSWSRLAWLETLQRVQHAVAPDTEPWQGPFVGWMDGDGSGHSSKLKETMVRAGFDASKMSWETIETDLKGEVRDGFLRAMRETWCRMVTAGWTDRKKEEFRSALHAEYERLWKENEGVAVQAVVLVCRK